MGADVGLFLGSYLQQQLKTPGVIIFSAQQMGLEKGKLQ